VLTYVSEVCTASIIMALITLMMEAVQTPETLVNSYQSTTQKTAIFLFTAMESSSHNISLIGAGTLILAFDDTKMY
jgi:hypothetical protein